MWIPKKERHLLAGTEVEFECQSTGSAPETKFTWFIGSQPLDTVIDTNGVEVSMVMHFFLLEIAF